MAIGHPNAHLRRLVTAGLAAAACAAAGPGCGDDDAPPSPSPAGEEAPDPRGPLPDGWRRVVNRRAGFSLGVPPGWTARGARGATLVRSGDRLLAVSIAADRSADGRELPAAVYARRTARALPGYRGLKLDDPSPVRGARYPGAGVSATGTFARTRLRQAIRVVALRRRRQVTYTLVFFRTAGSSGALYRPAVRGMLRTFRGQPPEY